MTTVAVSSDTPTVVDPSSFRSVFALPQERLILLVVDSDCDADLLKVIESIRGIRGEGDGLKLVVYVDGGAWGSKPSLSALPGVKVLEAWARPLLPEILDTADASFLLGRKAQEAVSSFAHRLRKRPVTVPARIESDLLAAILARELFPHSHSVRTSGLFPSEAIERPGETGDYVLQNDWGIGDELLLSAVAREIVRAYPSCGIWIRSRHGFRFPPQVRRDPIPPGAKVIETIYQNATLYGPAAHSPFPGHLVQQMLDKFALETNLKVKAADLRPELEFERPVRREEGTVILHSKPNSRLSSKDWGLERWERLSKLLSERGLRVWQVGAREEPLLPGVQDMRGVAVCELPEVFARASAVVSVVGFLMHLAEATNTPAVVIYGGRETPAIDGYPDQIHLSSEPLPCRGRWGCHLGPDLECPHGMKCMDSLSPELIAGEVFSLLERRGDS